MRALLPKFPAEALARIIDPEYGMISPDIFIPAAESKGFIIPFGDIVLDQVFKFISQHDNDGLGLSYIEINLSVAQCMEKKSMLNEAATGNGKIILDHTVRMMKSIGKELVAEGAETVGDVTMLKNMNCDYIQGFYFSKPLPAAEFVSFLKQNQSSHRKPHIILTDLRQS